MKLTVSVALLIVLTKSSSGWDLSPLGINNDFRLLHISLHYVRTFLCIEFNNGTFPTLVETTWPENLLAIKPKIFPDVAGHARNKSDCSGIIRARWTDIDKINRLWVLDSGSEHCPPKLIIYDLIHRNKEIFRANCNYFKWNEVTSMKLDPNPKQGQGRAYFTVSHGRYLVVFHLRSTKWFKLPVISGSEWHSRLVHSHEIAFTLDHRIYVTDNDGHLYIADTYRLKGMELPAKFLGSLLDKSKGLITDPAGLLYYILPRHGAVARWEPKRTLSAEGHEILFFQSISTVQIFFGVRGSVWVATEYMHQSRDHCSRILHHFGANSSWSDFI